MSTSSEAPLLIIFNSYKDARDSFRQRIEDGTCTWYGKGKGHADDFSAYARDAWDTGLVSYPLLAPR